MLKKILTDFIIVVNLIFCFALFSMPVRGVTTQGMVGYWKLDGNSDDISGYNHNGKSPGKPVYGDGKTGQCLELDGKNAYVTIENNDGRLTISHAVTIEAWINPNNFGTGYRCIFTKNESYALAIFKETVAVRGVDGWWKPEGFPLETSQWYHVAWTYDGSYNKIYINGKETAFISAFGSFPKGKKIYMGHPVSPFDGRVDEVKIYDRALSSAEIYCSYYEGLALVGYWTLDGNAEDSSGFDHDGAGAGAGYVGSWVGLGLKCHGDEGSSGSDRNTGKQSVVAVGNRDGSLTLSKELTIEAWSRADDFGKGFRHIFEYSGAYGLSLHDGKPAMACAGGWWITQYTGLKKGKWYHIAAAYNGRWKKIYIDGKEIASAPQTGTISPGSTIKIGHEVHGFRGIIDEVKVYNRALPAAIIERNFNDIPVPVAIWSFDDNARDKSGNGHDGKRINGPRYMPGKINRCIFLDGNNDYVVTSNKNHTLDLVGIISMEAWIKGFSFKNDYQHIYDKYDSNTLSVSRGSLAMGGGGKWWHPHSTSLKPNEWYHVVGTFDSGVRRLYINGVLVALQSINAISGPGIAAYIGNPYLLFHGLIDEVKIYQNTLSTRDILIRFRAGNR